MSVRARKLGLAAEIAGDEDPAERERIGRMRIPATAAADRDVRVRRREQLRALVIRKTPSGEELHARAARSLDLRAEMFGHRIVAMRTQLHEQLDRLVGREGAHERIDEQVGRVARELFGDREEHEMSARMARRRHARMEVVAIDAERHDRDRPGDAARAERFGVERVRHDQPIERVRGARPIGGYALPFGDADAGAKAPVRLREMRRGRGDERDVGRRGPLPLCGQLESEVLRIGELGLRRCERRAHAACVETAHVVAREPRVHRRCARRAVPEQRATIAFGEPPLPARGECRAARFEKPRAEFAVLGRRAVLVVAQRHRTGDSDRDAEIAGAQAIVGVLEVAVERGVERADAIEAIAPDVRERERDALHLARARVLRDVVLDESRFGLLAPQAVGLDEAAAVIDAAFGFRAEQAAADDTVFGRRVRRVAQTPEPVVLRELQIVVEQHDVVVGPRGGDAGVHAAHEAEIFRHRQDAHAIGVRGQRARCFVGAAVVDDDDFGVVEIGREQRIEAALGQRPLVPGEDDQRGAAHAIRPAARRIRARCQRKGARLR